MKQRTAQTEKTPEEQRSRRQIASTLRITYDLARGRVEYYWIHIRYVDGHPILVEERYVQERKEVKTQPRVTAKDVRNFRRKRR